MKFDQQAFNQFVIDNDVIGFFEEPITLKSGRQSNWYVNWRTISEDVFLMDQLSDFVIAFVQAEGLLPDCFYGVPEGATKLGLLTQFKWAKASAAYGRFSHCFPMGRAKPKEHGVPKDKYYIGAPSGQVIVLEDTTTTGLSLLNTIAALKEQQVTIMAAIGLTNRMEKRDDGRSVEQAIRDQGVRYLQLSGADQLLPAAIQKLKPSERIRTGIANEIEAVGTAAFTI